MGRGALVLYRNTPENAEVAGDTGIPFERGELPDAIRHALALSDYDRECYRRAALARVRDHYSWDAVTTAYEALLDSIARRH